ncbi:hypothetical protein [Anaerovorax sp. IOR16]|uniref:hypothetical protein n=1 Tax=Anaerovorax sp. IOR16 TaxID=2773458 RepID=UPI0019D2905B|nr:hypothetical protein [Anaerovorax sp. IOR16]
MDFINYCICVIEYSNSNCSDEEKKLWSIKLSRFLLFLYDRQNLWSEYILHFDELLKRKDLFFEYYEPPSFFVPDVYIIEQKNAAVKLHFLYAADERYQIIKRKIEKKNTWKNVEHLKCHQQYSLSSKELDRRYRKIINKLKEIV